MEIVDFELIESHKENIEPLKEGRSALSLKQIYSMSNDQLKSKQVDERSKFEQQLKLIDELDDPLQPYLDYIDWITNNYPSGVTVESGLVQVLERCTSEFRDTVYYKNDPRYLKVWLNYAKYSENPRDIFVYLSRKEIGKNLATYYEEFANYLESNNRISQALTVYKEGLKQNARPVNRLEKRFNEFEKRIQSKPLENQPQSPVFPQRSVLSVKSGASLFDSNDDEIKTQKRKLDIFIEDDHNSSDVKIDGWDHLGDSNYRNKENKIQSKSWNGEVLKQQEVFKKPLLNKINVFNDNSPVYKIIEVPGKKTEKIDVNFNLLYTADEEFCIQEIYAKLIKNKLKSPNFKSLVPSPIRFNNIENTVNLKLNLNKKNSPTETFFTNEAKNDIMSMFNQKLKPVENNDDYELIYDDQTELLSTHNPLNDLTIKGPKDEILDKEYVVSPIDESLQHLLINDLNPSIDTYNGYYTYSNDKNLINHLKKSLNLKQKNTVFIEFKSNGNTFNLKSLLGEGGYACVYLAESMNGKFKAIKAQKPSSSWEFYILKQIEKRLIESNLNSESFINCDEIHIYKDESYLVLNYLNQGTILDIVNIFNSINKKIDETFIIFITIELLKSIETLHDIGILHGDLKPDNCMLRLNNGNDYSSRGIKLIDFGRSIDMTLFPKNIKFKSNWKSDNQDCPEIKNKETWTYEIDYFGVASIVHLLLFGTFIEIELKDRYVLKNQFKRYWSKSLWDPLFNLLINSKNFGTLPITDEIKKHRIILQQHLKQNDSNLLGFIRDIETGLK